MKKTLRHHFYFGRRTARAACRQRTQQIGDCNDPPRAAIPTRPHHASGTHPRRAYSVLVIVGGDAPLLDNPPTRN